MGSDDLFLTVILSEVRAAQMRRADGVEESLIPSKKV